MESVTGAIEPQQELPRVRYALPKNINFQNAVVDEVTENPHTSTRAVAATLNISQSTIIRTLKALKFHPYKMILQQELHGEDFQKRTEFCNFIQRQNGVYSHILFSDEATFRSDSIVNRHNMHYWSVDNPHWAFSHLPTPVPTGTQHDPGTDTTAA
jgi:hypothetical protein